MAVLKNKTQKNFTIISNNVLRDKELSMKDRGVLCTICSLPDEWKFSISGLMDIKERHGVLLVTTRTGKACVENMRKGDFLLKKKH